MKITSLSFYVSNFVFELFGKFLKRNLNCINVTIDQYTNWLLLLYRSLFKIIILSLLMQPVSEEWWIISKNFKLLMILNDDYKSSSSNLCPFVTRRHLTLPFQPYYPTSIQRTEFPSHPTSSSTTLTMTNRLIKWSLPPVPPPSSTCDRLCTSAWMDSDALVRVSASKRVFQ